MPWASERRWQLRFEITLRRIELGSGQEDAAGEVGTSEVSSDEVCPSQVGAPEVRASESARFADPEDVVAMKAYSIGRRAVARDYIDIYFALRSGVTTMDALVEKARRVYELHGERLFDAALFAGQLTYTTDLEDKEVSIADVLDGKISWDDVAAGLSEAGESWLRDHVVGDPEGGVEPMSLPASVASIFWNVDPKRLDEKRDAKLIISSVLPRGGEEALRWLFRTYGSDRVRSVVLEDARGLRTMP